MKLEHNLIPRTKINSKCLKILNIRHDTIKFLEENVRVNLCDLRLDNSFLDVTPKTHAIKEILNKHDKIKIKSF